MAVVGITEPIDETTNMALKLQEQGDFKGTEKQQSIAVYIHESGEDGAVVASAACPVLWSCCWRRTCKGRRCQ